MGILVGIIPRTFLKRLEALKRDLECVLVGEFPWIIEDVYAEERDYRHDGQIFVVK
jgi:hypothetical protein